MKKRFLTGHIAWLTLLVLASAETSPVHGKPPRIIDGCHAADVTGDGRVDSIDFDLVLTAASAVPPVQCRRKDLDGSGFVDDPDVAIVDSFLGLDCGITCPADLDDDDVIDENDRQILLNTFDRDCRADLTRDSTVDEFDLEVMDAYLSAPPDPDPPLPENVARADFDGDGDVDSVDRDLLIAAYGTDCQPDLNRDGTVDTGDLWSLLAAWGPCVDLPRQDPPPVIATDCDDDYPKEIS